MARLAIQYNTFVSTARAINRIYHLKSPITFLAGNEGKTIREYGLPKIKKLSLERC